MADSQFKPPETLRCHCGLVNQVRSDVNEGGMASIRCAKCAALLVQPTPDWKEVAAEVIRLMHDRERLCRYCNQPGTQHSLRVGGSRDQASAKVDCPAPYVPIAAETKWDGYEHLVLKEG